MDSSRKEPKETQGDFHRTTLLTGPTGIVSLTSYEERTTGVGRVSPHYIYTLTYLMVDTTVELV